MTLHQTKNYHTAKEIINRTKRQLKVWEKMCANHTCHKDLIPKVYNEFLQLSSKSNESHILKWAKVLNGYFSKEAVRCPQVYKEMLHSTSDQDNANQSHNEILLHT